MTTPRDGVAPHRAILAERLHAEHRKIGAPFWHELSGDERAQWYRVARHLERNLSATALLELSK